MNDIENFVGLARMQNSKWIGINLIEGRLNTDTSPQNFWTTFLDNDLAEKFKKSAVTNAIAIPLPLCFSCFVPLRRFRENLTKQFYFYLSRTCDSPGGTPSVISLALIRNEFQSKTFTRVGPRQRSFLTWFPLCREDNYIIMTMYLGMRLSMTRTHLRYLSCTAYTFVLSSFRFPGFRIAWCFWPWRQTASACV